MRVVVVGGGMGGLVSAALLSSRGVEVTLLERDRHLGGKIRRERVAGRDINAGPTVLTMLEVFEHIFAELSLDLHERVRVARAEILARHFWSHGHVLDLYADAARSAEAIARFAGSKEAARFRGFCKYAAEIYEVAAEPFMRSRGPAWRDMLDANLRTVAGMRRADPMRKMWAALSKHFTDPRLRQLFGRYATYYGSSPFEAPATLNLIAHVEMRGMWTVAGGMSALADAVADAARERGCDIRNNTEVERIEVNASGRACGVVVDGELFAADAVVFNGDVGALAQGMLGAALAADYHAAAFTPRSFSALTVATVATPVGRELAYHNVFFSDDYAAELEDLRRGRLPSDPTVYLCAEDRSAEAPMGPERLFLIVNAPALGADLRLEVDRCLEAVTRRLERCGLRIESAVQPPIITAPRTFASRYPGSGGALYGRATHSPWAALTRPGVRSKRPGLYLCGGSVHPGAGVPMAALSGRAAAMALLEDHPSISRSPQAGTAGGTWTRSARADASASP